MQWPKTLDYKTQAVTLQSNIWKLNYLKNWFFSTISTIFYSIFCMQSNARFSSANYCLIFFPFSMNMTIRPTKAPFGLRDFFSVSTIFPVKKNLFVWKFYMTLEKFMRSKGDISRDVCYTAQEKYLVGKTYMCCISQNSCGPL